MSPWPYILPGLQHVRCQGPRTCPALDRRSTCASSTVRRPGDMPVINRNSCASALPTAARPGGVRGGMDKGGILLRSGSKPTSVPTFQAQPKQLPEARGEQGGQAQKEALFERQRRLTPLFSKDT